MAHFGGGAVAAEPPDMIEGREDLAEPAEDLDIMEGDDTPEDEPAAEAPAKIFPVPALPADAGVEAADEFVPAEMGIDVDGFDMAIDIGVAEFIEIDADEPEGEMATGISPYQQVALGKKWIGTDADLHWLADIPELVQVELSAPTFTDASLETLKNLKSLQVLKLVGTKITGPAALKFRLEKTDLTIEAEPTVRMGIYFDTSDPERLIVSAIIDGSPAASADVQIGDELQLLAGEKCQTFPDLKILLLGRQPDEKITLQLQRGEETLHRELGLQVTPKESHPEAEAVVQPSGDGEKMGELPERSRILLDLPR